DNHAGAGGEGERHVAKRGKSTVNAGNAGEFDGGRWIGGGKHRVLCEYRATGNLWLFVPLRGVEAALNGKRRGLGICAGIVALSGVLTAQQSTAPSLPQVDRELSRAIFKQLIEINSQDSNGSVTAAATAMRER